MAAEGSVIGAATIVRGNVRGDGSIEIYGRVDGDVDVSGDVTLGEQATVRGDITGARITIGGVVAGELRASEAVVLERTAQVTGDITAPRVGIEEGARARGALRTEEPSAPAGARAAVADQRRPVARPAEVRRMEPHVAPRATESPRPAAPPPRIERVEAPPAKKQPPAPVVPAFRGLQARKKKVRGR
jgi:cytoskeletal protein CcmA (bactofilin family)